MDTPFNEKDLVAILANPFYAVNFASHLFKKHSDLGSKEDWVAANAYAIKDIGTKQWLSELLDFISQARSKYSGRDILNPTPVINISDRLESKHEALVTRELWIQANEKSIAQMGSEAWLWQLLDTLESGGP